MVLQPSEDSSRSIDEEVQRLRNGSSSGVRPVTLRQLMSATRAHSEAPFCIDGTEVVGVVTVAQVVRVRPFDTATLLELEDGTGKMMAKRWLNGRDTDGLPPPTEDQYYARIIGTLGRGQERRNTLTVQAFQKITDPHQLFLHLLEAAFVTLCLERGPPSESVRRSVGPRFPSGGDIDQPTLPSAPTTPAVARVARPYREVSSAPTQSMGASSSATPSRSHFSSPSPEPRPQTPPPPTPLRQASSSPEPPPRTPSPSTPPPSNQRSIPKQPSPEPARASSAAIPQTSGSRRVSGIKPDPWAHLTVLQRAILLQIFNAEEEVSVRAIARGVNHYEVTPAEIGSALDVLTEEGFIEPLDLEHYTIKTSHYPTSS